MAGASPQTPWKECRLESAAKLLEGYGMIIVTSQRRAMLAESGMVTNVGIAAGIGSQDHSVQYLLPLPFSVSAILNFGSN